MHNRESWLRMEQNTSLTVTERARDRETKAEWKEMSAEAKIFEEMVART